MVGRGEDAWIFCRMDEASEIAKYPVRPIQSVLAEVAFGLGHVGVAAGVGVWTKAIWHVSLGRRVGEFPGRRGRFTAFG